jgi:DNA-binding response OmpR family regulator
LVTRVIVLADDDRSMREALTTALEAHGFEVVEASSGAEAIELASKKSADAVISDISMPDGSGLDVLSALSERGGEIPVIVVSGHAENQIREAALAAGAAAYLVKPIGVGELIRVLDAALRS